MIQANEIVMFTLGLLVFVYVLQSMPKMKKIPEWKIFWVSFCFLLAAWASTILEEFILNTFFNYLEHFLYMSAALMLLYWSFKITSSKGESVK